MAIDRCAITRSALQAPPSVKGASFDEDRIRAARASNRLLSVSLLLSDACNLNCLYCYRNAGTTNRPSFSLSDWTDTLYQARDLGAQSVWIPGSGEPLADPAFCDGRSLPLVELANHLGMSVTFFTNGTLLNDALVAVIKTLDVSVVAKLNSFVPHIQDYLVGKNGASEAIWRGVNLLLDAGLADESPTRLGIDTVIVAQNYCEMPRLFRFCRDRNIVPYITANLHGGRACTNSSSLDVPRDQLKQLFEELLMIDRSEYGYDWFPSPPIVAGQCKKLLYDVVIDSQGSVFLCPGIHLCIGNISDRPLAEIVASSDILAKVRQMPRSLSGQCGSCVSKDCVYGCRLEAWASGDLFGPDPMCWHGQPATPCMVGEQR